MTPPQDQLDEMSPEEPCSSSAFKPVAISPNGRFSADIPHVSMVGKDKVIIGVIIGVIDRAINILLSSDIFNGKHA